MFNQKVQAGIHAFLSWVLGFVLSIFPFWLLLVALCFYYRYVGIKAAKNRGEKLQKNGWKRTIDKIGVYTGWILVGGLFQFVFKDEVPELQHFSIAKFFATMICFAEMDSILFNVSEYSNRDYRKLLYERIPFFGGWIADNLNRDKSRFFAIHKTKKKETVEDDTNINQDKE